MPNVDQKELAKFSTLAPDWWDSNGPCKPLHLLNPLRLQFIEQQVAIENKRILDIGCGGGILTESLAARGAKVTGIDLSIDVLNIARAHSQAHPLDINYLHIDAENLAAQQAQTFDIITCMEMLEHVPEPASIIQACARLVKPGGTVFFSTLNRTLKAFIFAIIGAEYLLKLLPKGTHEYAKFIRPNELAATARRYDLQLKAIAGINYNLFTKNFYLTHNPQVNYLICLQKLD